MQFNYAEEKLLQAINSLIINGPLIERLEAATIYLFRLRTDDFPESLRQEFTSIKESLTRVPGVADEGSIRATLKGMAPKEMEECAHRIHSLYRHMMEFNSKDLSQSKRTK